MEDAINSTEMGAPEPSADVQTGMVPNGEKKVDLATENQEAEAEGTTPVSEMDVMKPDHLKPENGSETVGESTGLVNGEKEKVGADSSEIVLSVNEPMSGPVIELDPATVNGDSQEVNRPGNDTGKAQDAIDATPSLVTVDQSADAEMDSVLVQSADSTPTQPSEETPPERTSSQPESEASEAITLKNSAEVGAAAVALPPEPEVPAKTGSQPTPDPATEILLSEMQDSLKQQMEERAKAEKQAQEALEEARAANSRAEVTEEELQVVRVEKQSLVEENESLKNQLESALSDRSSLLVELDKLREVRDEFERKEMVLSSRVNAAKKKEAMKANLVEGLEDQIKTLQDALEKQQLKLKDAKENHEKAVSVLKTQEEKLEQRVKQVEKSLLEERKLNDDRKKKMKSYVEAKSEELREARAQVDELNLELSQTNRSMREHHTRWKQLHAQWVQSQTRNRELQRDLNRMKKDSENMSRLGDHMTMQLSRSAQETEEHKNRRLTAKNELMNVLKSLEHEKEISAKLRDSIKFTFTPKALSQQQLMKESLQDLETELDRLSRRLGKPLLPPTRTSDQLYVLDPQSDDGSSVAESMSSASSGGKRSRSEIDTQHLISNLEDETQRLSQGIMALGSSIERFHRLLVESGDRTCFTVFNDLFATVPEGNSSTEVGAQATSVGGPRLALGASRTYGQVPASAVDED